MLSSTLSLILCNSPAIKKDVRILVKSLQCGHSIDYPTSREGMTLLKKVIRAKQSMFTSVIENKMSWCGWEGQRERQLLEWKNKEPRTLNTNVFIIVVFER